MCRLCLLAIGSAAEINSMRNPRLLVTSEHTHQGLALSQLNHTQRDIEKNRNER